jgi:hypothetical protein
MELYSIDFSTELKFQFINKYKEKSVFRQLD